MTTLALMQGLTDAKREAVEWLAAQLRWERQLADLRVGDTNEAQAA